MRKKVFLLVVVALLATSIKAQGSEEKNRFISVGFYSGEFTESLAKECYPKIGILDVSYMIRSDVEWFSWGLFIRQFGSEGKTWTTGNINAEDLSLSIFSWGPEAHIEVLNNLYFISRVGFLKVEEDWDGEIFSVKGNHVDFGLKYELPVGDKFGIFGKGEYSSVTLKEEPNFSFDSWIFGAGCSIKF